MNKTSRKGFTLIEILVVISVLGILAALILPRLGMSEKMGRDTRRKSDLNQYRIALENFAAVNNGIYPTDDQDGNSSADTGLFSSSGSWISSYLSSYPDDPLNNSEQGYNYYFRSASTGLTWVLQARLESESNASWQICSNGKIGKISGYTTNPDLTCDL